MKTKNLKIERQVFRGEHNELRSQLVIVLPDGRRVIPTNRVGFIWKMRTWADGIVRYSRGEMVFSFEGQEYRMGEKVARPLVLEEGEKLESVEFGGTAAFFQDFPCSERLYRKH